MQREQWNTHASAKYSSSGESVELMNTTLSGAIVIVVASSILPENCSNTAVHTHMSISIMIFSFSQLLTPNCTNFI